MGKLIKTRHVCTGAYCSPFIHASRLALTPRTPGTLPSVAWRSSLLAKALDRTVDGRGRRMTRPAPAPRWYIGSSRETAQISGSLSEDDGADGASNAYPRDTPQQCSNVLAQLRMDTTNRNLLSERVARNSNCASQEARPGDKLKCATHGSRTNAVRDILPHCGILPPPPR